MESRNAGPETDVKGSSDRSFGVVFTVVFLLVGLYPLLGGARPHWWSLALAFALAAISAARPSTLAGLNRAWQAFGLLLHRVVGPIVLGFQFFVVIAPIGLAMRLFGKDPLRRQFDPAASSYWIERTPPGPSADSLRNQF